jgi:lipopolysaccharide export system protein LptA
LLDRSTVIHKDGKTMTGDTIFYDKKSNFGEGFSKVVLNDSIQKTTLYGNYIYYNKKDGRGFATDSALLVDWASTDTMYVHADTLTTTKDSIYSRVNAFYNVRSFRVDVQSICDSLSYSTRDSVMKMYYQPVLWTENNQLSGDFIQAFIKNKEVEKIQIQGGAIAIQQEDSIYFNQLAGKEMIAYMDSGTLKKVEINGNAETIYFPRDEKDSTILGVNKTQSSFVTMYYKDEKIQRVVLTSASSGTMYPLNQLSNNELLLKKFFWIDTHRPKSKSDIFLRFPPTLTTRHNFQQKRK